MQESHFFDTYFHLDIETALWVVILSIFMITFLFFLMTLFKKLNRIRETRIKDGYQKEIDALLFEILFDDKNVGEAVRSLKFQNSFQSRLFQRVAIKAIISLSHSYSGAYSKKLKDFYAQSGLVNYSLNKLSSGKWEHIVEGIRDLSALGYEPAYKRIAVFKDHKNSFVQTEALLGMIVLRDVSEVMHFKDSKIYLNDWVQSNILFTIKKHRINAPHDLTEFLKSKNPSIVLLGVRLINHYKMIEHYTELSQFYRQMTDAKLKSEIAMVLEKTEQIQ